MNTPRPYRWNDYLDSLSRPPSSLTPDTKGLVDSLPSPPTSDTKGLVDSSSLAKRIGLILLALIGLLSGACGYSAQFDHPILSVIHITLSEEVNKALSIAFVLCPLSIYLLIKDIKNSRKKIINISSTVSSDPSNKERTPQQEGTPPVKECKSENSDDIEPDPANNLKSSKTLDILESDIESSSDIE